MALIRRLPARLRSHRHLYDQRGEHFVDRWSSQHGTVRPAPDTVLHWHRHLVDNDWRSGGVPVPVPLYEQIFAPGSFERHLAAVDALRPVAERNDMTLAQLALAWTVAQPGVTAAIAGSRSASRMREDAAAGLISLTRAQLEEIDQLIVQAAQP